MRTARTLVYLAMVVLLTACPKGKSGDKADAASSASPPGSSTAPTSASAATSASARPAGSATPSGAGASYAGTYTLAPASYHIAEGKDYAHVKQAKDDPSKLVGNGALSLTVDAQGRVDGVIDSGPAAPAIIDGSLVNGEIRGNVRRKTPSDDGLTGTVVGKIEGANVSGKLSLAESNAAIVRDGPITLTRK